MNKKTLALILSNALLLSTGIILILVSCIQYDNWWPFLTIFVNMFAIFFPTFCGGCALGDSDEYGSMWNEGDNDASVTPASISWLFLGFFIIVGYAIPIELFRGNLITEQGVYLTVSGGTTILAAILIFVRLILFKKDRDSAYFI